MKEQLADLLKKDFTQLSKSPYASRIPLNDDTLRMCVGYRELNKFTVKDSYPLPRIDEPLDRLHGAGIFSKLALRAQKTSIELRAG